MLLVPFSSQKGKNSLLLQDVLRAAGLKLIKVRQQLNVLSKRHDALCLRSMTLLQLLGKIMASFAVLGALFLEGGGTE